MTKLIYRRLKRALLLAASLTIGYSARAQVTAPDFSVVVLPDTQFYSESHPAIFNAQTQWNARGDLFSVAEIASSLSAHHAPRVEGRGARQADGSILAQSIKAEDNR